MPAPAPVRDALLTVGAGLPKRDWEFAAETMSRLPELDTRIVVGLTQQHEDMATLLTHLLDRFSCPPRLQVNLDRSQVFDLYARASVVLYPILPEARIGNPMSVIEAAAAGAIVMVADRPELRKFCGPVFEPIRDVDATVARIREIVRGGPAIDAMRERNRAWARERFGTEEPRRRFYEALQQALAAWTEAPPV